VSSGATPAEIVASARAHLKAGAPDAAEKCLAPLLEEYPDEPALSHLFGLVRHEQERYGEALDRLTRAVERKPASATYRNNLGNTLRALGRVDEAEVAYREALKINSQYAGAWYNLGGLYQDAGKQDQAESAFRSAIQHKPEFLDAWFALYRLMMSRGSLEKAGGILREVLRRHPNDARGPFEWGGWLQAQGRLLDSVKAFGRAVHLQPEMALAHNNLGAALQSLGNLDRAEACFRRALALKPGLSEAWYNLARILDTRGHLDDAAKAYQKAIRLEPADAVRIRCYLEHLRLKQADWSDYAARQEDLFRDVQLHLKQPHAASLPPLSFNVFNTPAPLRAAVAAHQAHAIVQRTEARKSACAFKYPEASDGKLRIGYVSPDFRQHAVGTLIDGLFDHHDRTAFEVYAYGLVPVEDDINRRIRMGCDVYVDASRLSPEQTARRIHADGIHILVDLGGYTTHTRTELFAFEPAPVQAHWLGYLDTMGAPFLPYIITDPIAVPEVVATHFSEAIVYLPECFVATAPPVQSKAPLTRADCGLPEDGFVFCCFNAHHKIDPGVFDLWMRVLGRVPGSVLWLYEGECASARDNLRREAEAHGVAADRLIFARRRAMPEYVSQHRLADLFLDTFVYNAGTTAVCALGAGLPVLTRPGESYLARMGASLVRAAGLPELVCEDAAAYEERAATLATHPHRARALRDKLATRQASAALFDVPRWVCHLEAAFRMMWRNHVEKTVPRTCFVPVLPLSDRTDQT